MSCFNSTMHGTLYNSYSAPQGSFVNGTLHDRYGYNTGHSLSWDNRLLDRFGYDTGLRRDAIGDLVNGYGARTGWTIR